MLARKKVLFLNLTAFSQTGGIEKFNRCFLKALFELEDAGNVYSNAHSLYDEQTSDRYYPSEKYTSFSKSRVKFVLQSLYKARRFNCIIIGHINLAIIGCILKLLYPEKKIFVITHGIEVWGKLPMLQRILLRRADKILSVSKFTKDKMLNRQEINEKLISIFPNTIDPFFAIPKEFKQEISLRKKYNLEQSDLVLFTLTRLSDKEKYKGYDIVVQCLPELLKTHRNIKYIIAGKYDENEKKRLDELIQKLNLQEHVFLTGFIDEEKLAAHYQMSDVYIMPSKKEGFGIVFIEAMTCGLPVIAGNIDGSVDALRNGELGTLINPDNKEEIISAINKVLLDKHNYINDHNSLQQKTLEYFGFPKFKERLKYELAG
jgi:phosphatidylinositol alpha-1,6-mannosyltransferase